MSRRSWSSRFALWAAVCALVLKAAVPLFAAAAAQLRGVPVAEVCTVYGVALPAPSHDDHDEHAHHALHHGGHSGHEDHGSHDAAAHTGDHCALNALAALSAQETPTLGVVPAHAGASDTIPPRTVSLRDASAAWVARLKHGPPHLT